MPNKLAPWIAAICAALLCLAIGCSAGSSGASNTPTTPLPAISSISPAFVEAGTGATTVTVVGTGFTDSTVIQVGGVAEPTTYVSNTQVTALIPPMQLATAGTASITATNGGTSNSSGAVSLQIKNPVPTLTQVVPSTVVAGSAPSPITITGTGFVGTSTVQVDGGPRQTTFVSDTQLTAVLTAADLATGVTHSISVLNPAPGGGASSAMQLPVNNPVPTITQVNPASLTAGSGATTVTVTGTNFVSTTLIQVGGSSRSTLVVSPTQVTFQLTSADLSAAGSINIAALNPSPGGGTSASATVAISNPVPGTLSLNPYLVLTGTSTPNTVTVSGTNFVPASTVQVGGTPRATTYLNGTQLTFQLTAADQATTANLNVTVSNPAPEGGTSPAAVLAVAAPTPTPVISSVTPSQIFTDSAATTISVLGTGLTNLSTVQWNGTNLPTSYTNCLIYLVHHLCLQTTVPANLLTTAGTASVTVNTPTATPANSNALQVTITDPPVPTLTSLSVSAGAINTGASIGVTGSGFASSSSMLVNETAVPTKVGSSTSLSANVPASLLAVPGNYNIQVTTAPPGGGTSAPLVYTAYIPLPNNSIIYNPMNGLLYASIPGSAGAPYGNSIVSVDPATGALGKPIYVGSEPDKLALTADGTILWVGLDGAASVRQVNLATSTAGLQFPIQGFSIDSSNIPPVRALAAVPGLPNAVIVSANATAPVIYDNGVLRGSLGVACIGSECANALQVDGTKNEIYAAAADQYYVYSYDSSGLTLKTSVSAYGYTGSGFYGDTSGAFSYAVEDEFQLLSGTIYSDLGYAHNAESGSLIGTFYNSANYNYPASGPAYADATLGKIFYLDTASSTSYLYQQIQAFNLSDYTASSAPAIPINVVSTTTGSLNANPSRLFRWGSNGLAFRTARAIYSLTSNSVNDLSSVNADIRVSLAASGGNTTGTTTTYVATITDAGPANGTNVVFTAQPPSTGKVMSATTSSGQCSTTPVVVCDLGALANGASVAVNVTVAQLSSGSSTLQAQVTGSENDPNTANNQASATVAISGSTYSPTPVLTAVNPAAIASASSDTTITVTGSGFTNTSTVLVGGAPQPTSYLSATQLSAVVPAAELTSLGWNTVSVSNPSPGGGTSASLPLSIYSVIAAGANHILYDPYTRKVMASIGSGPNANAIVALTPETVTLGTPVPIGNQPSALALTADGQILYAALTGSNSVARYNMLTQQLDFTVPIGATYSNGSPINLGGMAVQPGTENTIALNLGAAGTAIYDFNPVAKTAAIRGQANDRSIAYCPQFLDADHLLTTYAYGSNSYSSTLLDSTVPAGGFVFGSTSNATTSNLNGFVCVVASGGLAYGSGGVIVDPSTAPATVIGTFPQYLNWAGSNYDSIQNGIPDTSLGRSFFITTITPPCGPCNNPGGITAYSQSNFLLTDVLDLNIESFEGNYSYSSVDLVRWGQDGLAALTSSGRIYLLRGPVVVPQLLNQNSPATLTSSSLTTIAHGSSNTLLTLTGSNLVPGIAVTWNGSYRTTTIVDATHLTVAIPASDLESVGTATVVATNPGATSSSAITITIN